jgi:hypothetical protein
VNIDGDTLFKVGCTVIAALFATVQTLQGLRLRDCQRQHEECEEKNRERLDIIIALANGENDVALRLATKERETDQMVALERKPRSLVGRLLNGHRSRR